MTRILWFALAYSRGILHRADGINRVSFEVVHFSWEIAEELGTAIQY